MTLESRTIKGRQGEDAALEFLEKRGLRLLERNYRVGHREIDLIMESDERVHIIEVKAMMSSSVADPTDRVDERKRGYLAAAAAAYVALKQISKEVQFDVVSVVAKGTEFMVEYLPEAFIPVYYK